MPSKRGASADAVMRERPFNPGPFLQRRGRAQEAETAAADHIEPQDVVRARIDDIELQIVQLEQKREALKGVAQVVTASGGEKQPAFDPAVAPPGIAGKGMRLPPKKDTGAGVGVLETSGRAQQGPARKEGEGPPVMALDGQEAKPGEPNTDDDGDPDQKMKKMIKKVEVDAHKRMEALEKEVAILKSEGSMARILSMEVQMANLLRNAKAEPWASPWATPGTGVPAPVDKKLMERPGKYKGDIKVFIQWHERLKTFLTAQDKRWPKILEAIEARGQKH